MPRLDPRSTTWHITFGTYGLRLHGGDRVTVDRRQGRPGEAFVHRDPDREAAQRGQMSQPAVRLTLDQQQFIQQIVPELCQRGGWAYRVCSAGADHVHVLLDIEPAIDGERVRRILKRWLTQALDRRWGKPRSGRWWARQGSNKPIDNERYLSNATEYIACQCA